MRPGSKSVTARTWFDPQRGPGREGPWQTSRVLTRNTTLIAAALVRFLFCAGCGAATPEAAALPQHNGAPAPAAAESEPAAAPESESPLEERIATSPSGEAPSSPASCRVETAALTCISRACFGRPDRKAGPSGYLPVQIRFNAAGEIAAFEPEVDAPEWGEILACARQCVERSTRPRDCQTRIFLHTKKDPTTE